MANTDDAHDCTTFRVWRDDGVAMNPGYSTGVFTLNSYPEPRGIYGSSAWCGTVTTPTITGTSGTNPFSLNNFGQNTNSTSPNYLKYYWSYNCSISWITELQIIYKDQVNDGGILKDEYKIYVRCSNNTGGSTRCQTVLLTLGSGSLYCTVFPLLISQGTSTDSCIVCI